mmetsp:Transcript_4426/g.9685  ORF Transcript_4426/g.9685 Transcript_4426/m.9685 type:complete len:265 (-) Transcript_4426:61-855(-)
MRRLGGMLASRALSILGTTSGSTPPVPPAAAETTMTAAAPASDLASFVGVNGAKGMLSHSTSPTLSVAPSATSARSCQPLSDPPMARSSSVPSGVPAPATTIRPPAGIDAAGMPSPSAAALAAAVAAAVVSSPVAELLRRFSTAASTRAMKSDSTSRSSPSSRLSMASCAASSERSKSSWKADTCPLRSSTKPSITRSSLAASSPSSKELSALRSSDINSPSEVPPLAESSPVIADNAKHRTATRLLVARRGGWRATGCSPSTR